MNDAAPATKALKILIVDDNGGARAMLKEFLLGDAGEFYECEDGADALAAYEAFLPDFVLMDWEMKRVNGLAATRLIVAHFPDAAVLIVSNHDAPELRTAATEAGARGVVLKHDLLSLPPLLRTSQTSFA